MHPPPDLVARFRSDLLALGIASEARLGLAVSGGPDSLALLLLAHGAGLTVEAATVDHGLRVESAAEAAFVAEVCASVGVPHATLQLGERGPGNLSDWARRERYAALQGWADERRLDAILTAHHADDQLETMVMRLNRGSGVAGLAGIRVRNGRIARPLLGWRKAELERIVAETGLTAVDDPSNRDDRFDRARLRRALAGADWLDPVAAALSARALGQAEEALDWAAAEAARARVVRAGDLLHINPNGLPAELVRRLFGSAVKALANSPAPLRSGPLSRALAALREGRTVTLGGVKCTGGDIWTLRLAPPRRRSSAGSSAGGIVR